MAGSKRFTANDGEETSFQIFVNFAVDRAVSLIRSPGTG
jgi:hypothetical protein